MFTERLIIIVVLKLTIVTIPYFWLIIKGFCCIVLCSPHQRWRLSISKCKDMPCLVASLYLLLFLFFFSFLFYSFLFYSILFFSFHVSRNWSKIIGNKSTMMIIIVIMIHKSYRDDLHKNNSNQKQSLPDLLDDYHIN